MTNRKDLMHDFASINGEVAVGDGAPLKIAGKGRIMLKMSKECRGNDIELKDVLYVPELQDNLISQGQIEENGLKIVTHEGTSKIMRNEKMIFHAHRVSRLYYVMTLGSTTVDNIKETYDRKKKVLLVSLATWHSRLGHRHLEAVKKLEVLDELSTNLSDRESECSPGIQGKMRQEPFPTGEGEKAKEVLDKSPL
ncbi:uncharacterized protein LOC111870744 [Cryptotermes secundus]|uniref:uncharacterized protein LOC111870744 n=1 Tax=Cryptotermes secundus TaxID=105785 RepID=UPI000CD7CCBB|nr:uncharacterized protein LOC111870744 [Cryptotermes secundus]